MKVESVMKQKGFATILSLCLILVIALIVKGIQESEANHAREVLNFEMEQALQSAAESGIVEAAEYVRKNPNYLPYIEEKETFKKTIPVSNKIFYHGEQKIKIEVEVWGERGKIYLFPKDRTGNKIYKNDGHLGIYFMSRATIEEKFFNEKIYRRAYAHVRSEKDGETFIDDTTINFMELPTQKEDYVVRAS